METLNIHSNPYKEVFTNSYKIDITNIINEALSWINISLIISLIIFTIASIYKCIRMSIDNYCVFSIGSITDEPPKIRKSNINIDIESIDPMHNTVNPFTGKATI